MKKETFIKGLNPDERKPPDPNYRSLPNINLKKYMQEQRKGELHNTIDDTIKYFRIMEKEHQAGKREIGGLEILHAWVQNGTIKPYLYFKMVQAIENPDTPYNITVN